LHAGDQVTVISNENIMQGDVHVLKNRMQTFTFLIPVDKTNMAFKGKYPLDKN
jgi:hypothetical protein